MKNSASFGGRDSCCSPYFDSLKLGLSMNDPLFVDRDLSWLEFNSRVLNEAVDERTPLLERLVFSNIFCSNNDEFFMKRMGSVKGTQALIREKCCQQIELLSKNFSDHLLPALKNAGIKLLSYNDLSEEEKGEMESYFKRDIFPVLTPMAVDKGLQPFPLFISNLSKSIGIKLQKKGREQFSFARVKIPREIPQWLRLEGDQHFAHRFINVDEIILANIEKLFLGTKIIAKNIFRITRYAAVAEEEGGDIEDKMEWVEEGLKERKFAPIVRLELVEHHDPWISDFIVEELKISPEQIYAMPTMASYTSFSGIYRQVDLPELKYSKLISSSYPDFESDIFQAIRKRDHLVHFPYQSFKQTVGKFIEAAATDPKVVGIKITLYRTGSDGSIINSLITAAENKKEVSCIIELAARFDEERNIRWAQKLEEYGINVSYGPKNIKTHGKMIAVVRRDEDGVRTYVNISTGNYNFQTSKVYTDFSLFTCKQKIASEVLEIFNFLTGRSLSEERFDLLLAPFNMSDRFLELIEREADYARKGGKGRIIGKMNQMKDPRIIKALSAASAAGVEVVLLVRGFCSLRPLVAGLSENIRIFSVIGRFLEHSRLFYFGGGKSDPLQGRFYLGSADWVTRNLHERLEVVLEVLDVKLKESLWDYLNLAIKDNRNLWEMKSDGNYVQRVAGKGEREFNSQWMILK